MGNGLWFITLIQDNPWIGILIGLAFVLAMFGLKHLIVHQMTKTQPQAADSSDDAG